MVDRLQIQDLITRYYNNFGRENPENFSDFYADDAELILGERHFRAGRHHAGLWPRPSAGRSAAATTAPDALFVHRDRQQSVDRGPRQTATAQLVYTEYVIEKQGDPLKVTTQGKEYSIS